MRGNLNTQGVLLGVVGSRVPTTYGKQVTPRITREIASSGITIVSGLALGIDGLAHEAALEVSGKTIAILGSGIDDRSVYPSSHRNLAERIIKSGGTVISEYPSGTKPEKYHFPERNRIIAGVCQGILVIEAKAKSGALITAKLAVQENRDVFAVPGPITSENSFGTNRLIQLGAKAVLDANDILEEYGMDNNALRVVEDNLDEQEKIIFGILKGGPSHVDEIIIKSDIAAAALNALLVTMEIKGLIKSLGGGIYGL